MMATEATSEILAKSSAIPDHELNTTETSSQDVSTTEQPLVNGTPDSEKDETKQTAENVDASVNSAEVSVSGGSDTEASKTETTKTASGHLRTTSTVKKALSFKPVSVNKTFLAAKGATTSTSTKLGEKQAAGTPSTQTGSLSSSAPRPRLVAKSGSGLRDSTPRNSATANGGKAGAAPDASAVWNKNRPAAPPEPKRFTDEELKQRYGIHLATRLQSDEPGSKDKMWADIDDDDDDWAPETIEWTDGTKITLPQADEAPIPPPEPIPAPAPILKDVKPVEVPKPKSPAPAQSVSPTVKPSGFGSGRAGLVLKGAPEKPTLVAKPPGPPTPVKSPWASLPPVDKVAPVAIEIPQAQPSQQSRFGQRDPHGFQAMPPPPAKEIAADDFSRSSWREGNANTSRELYNSQSGRYEPVNDHRRGSTRNDARQPAVLQRPQQDGPAEPSAAFQTNRTSAQDSSYNRRRTSSNVSGGSGNFVRRMSRSGHEMPSHDMMNRRGSLAAVSDAPSSPSTQQPPNPRGSQPQNQQPWQSHASPAASHPSPHSTHGQMAPSVPGSVDDQGAPPTPILSEDQVFAEQKKRMQLARELAVKRRKEEEAKEEAAKRERIRIKLEAMGPPPEKPKSKAATPKQDKATPVTIHTRDPALEAVSPKVAEESTESKVAAVDKAPPLSAPLDIESNKSVAEPRTNGIHDSDSKTSNAPRSGQQDSRSSQPWQSNSAQNANRYQGPGPWAAPAQQPSRSVWGPPSNDRTLGNGTFNSELSRVPSMQHPGPIGPPNQNRNSGQFSQGRGRDGFSARPAPIGPPNRQLDSNLEDQRRLVASTGWAMASEKIQHDDSVLRHKHDSDLAQRLEQEAKGTANEISFKETWRAVKIDEEGDRRTNGEVLQPVDATEEYGSHRLSVEEQEADRRRNGDTVNNSAQPQFTDAWRSTTQSNMAPRARDSRFFPNNRDIRLEEQIVPFERPGSPSPPPPTMAGHPAYDGDIAHPHVQLPRPAPVVKLPPAVLAPIGPPKPATFAAAVIAPAVPIPRGPANQGRQDYASRAAASYQDIRRNPEPTPSPGGWQDRINSLIGRKNSPPKSHALAVDSSSKNALELPRSQNAATVSLPSLSPGVLSIDNGSTVSKPAAEECFEEQQMGSLPVIRVPHSAPAAAWSPAPQPPRSVPKKFHAAEVFSKDSISFPPYIVQNKFNFVIHLPGQPDEKQVQGLHATGPRQRSNPRSHGSRGARGGPPRQTSSSNSRGGRPKDSGFPSPKPENAILQSPSNPHHSGRGGHRGGRGNYQNWNRHASTPVQT